MSRLTLFGIAVLAAVAATPGEAQRRDRAARESGYIDRSPETCISLLRLRDTTIIDDSTVLSYLSGGDVYVNTLDPACFGLERAGRFLTQSRSNQLCRADMLQVFRPFLGDAYPTMTCRLGDFHPITRDEAALLELEPDELGAVQRSVVMTPLESIPLTDDGAPADTAGSGATDGADVTGSEPTGAGAEDAVGTNGDSATGSSGGPVDEAGATGSEETGP